MSSKRQQPLLAMPDFQGDEDPLDVVEIGGSGCRIGGVYQVLLP